MGFIEYFGSCASANAKGPCEDTYGKIQRYYH
jgi:hypothetical protein